MTVNGIYFNNLQPVSPREAEQCSTPSIKLEELPSRDSGISLTSPLTSSTPIESKTERGRTYKRRSLTDVASSGKRSKPDQGGQELATPRVQLKPRKIEEIELEGDHGDDSVVIIDSDSEYFSSTEIDFPNSDEEIEMSSSSSVKNELAIISTSTEDLTEDSDSYFDDSLGESFESCDDSEFDVEDIKALEEETSSSHVIVNSESNYSEESEKTEDLPALTFESKKNISEDDLIQRKRKKLLKKIRKKPLQERLVLHGLHPAFLPWKQKV